MRNLTSTGVNADAYNLVVYKQSNCLVKLFKIKQIIKIKGDEIWINCSQWLYAPHY